MLPEPRADTRGLAPGPPIVGSLRPPGSKSLAIRTLVAASLAEGTTRLEGLADADDVEAATRLVEAAGAVVARDGRQAVRVTGRPPDSAGGWSPRAPLFARESGTLARLATAALALAGRAPGRYRLEVSGTLARRTSPALLGALATSGVRLGGEGASRGGWPLEIDPVRPPPVVRLEGAGSSQEASGLLLALAASAGERELEIVGDLPSRPYFDMTRAVLVRFGACVQRVAAPPGLERWRTRGPLVAPAGALSLEADASAGAVALAAGALSGGAVEVLGVGRDALQGDWRIVHHLAAFGIETEAREASLLARGRPVRGATLDLAAEPDLAPVLAAVAGAVALAAARGGEVAAPASVLSGLGTLEGKESPRVTVLADGLRALGLRVRADRERLEIAPGAAPPPAGAVTLDPRGDHRMAFAFALLGLVRAGVRVLEPECVAKSWPRFWEDIAQLGAREGA